MLEHNGRLRTWALEQSLEAGIDVPCLALADHRLAYLDYEGPLSENRGQVTRVDRGEYTTIQEADDALTVRLTGGQLLGRLVLRRVAPTGESETQLQSWVARLFTESEA